MNGAIEAQARAPRNEWVVVGALASSTVAVLALLAPAVRHAVDLWSTTEEFSYGFLVVPIVVVLVFARRDRLRAAVSAGDSRGLIVSGAAVAFYVAAERANVNAAAGLAITPLLWGGVLYLWGGRVAREAAFPAAFLAFGFAAYRGLLDTVGFALQVATANGAETLSAALGVPVVLDGLVLRLPAFSFIVAEACSGMSSLLSLLALSSVIIFFTEARVTRKLVVIASVLPLVLVANTVRVSLVMLVAQRVGPDAALGFFHGASSLVLFGAALAGVIAVSQVLGCRIRVGS